MLGRPVKLIYYDDKSAPSEIPTIYTKLLDIDKSLSGNISEDYKVFGA
jgi:hypothetical protein